MNPKPLVYLLDDNLDFLEIMEIYFKKMDLQYRVFSDPRKYFSAIRSECPRISFIDLNFQGLSKGFEFITQVRALGYKHAIIVVSGTKNPEAVAHALECGANDYIFKPLDSPILNSKISNFVKTDELEMGIDKEYEIPGGGIEATVHFKGEVVGVDEIGFELESEQFVSNGTQIRVSGELVEALFPERTGVNLLVSKCSMDVENSTYSCYGEFLDLNENEVSSIRNWILDRSKNSAVA